MSRPKKRIGHQRCIVIAGPNGAGKTTFAREFLPIDARIVHFVNADLIAGGLSPLRPEIAARVKQGGHDVPRRDVLRRYRRSWMNFVHVYRPLAESWSVYDNSGARPILLEQSP